MFGYRVWDGEKLTANSWEKRKRANTDSSEIGAQRVERNENAGRMPALQNGDALKRALQKEKPRRSRGAIFYRIKCTSGATGLSSKTSVTPQVVIFPRLATEHLQPICETQRLEAELYSHLNLACASGEIGAEIFRSGMPEHRTIRNEVVGRDGKATYLAHGKVDFFGDEAMARTGGAGGQNRTGYARLFRAALYQ